MSASQPAYSSSSCCGGAIAITADIFVERPVRSGNAMVEGWTRAVFTQRCCACGQVLSRRYALRPDIRIHHMEDDELLALLVAQGLDAQIEKYKVPKP